MCDLKWNQQCIAYAMCDLKWNQQCIAYAMCDLKWNHRTSRVYVPLDDMNMIIAHSLYVSGWTDVLVY